uniref:Uncharacterized protein n=1 Tax=Cucumis melo TaxID=3656 RepID=A0A9I9EGN9_CUCME
MKRVPASVLHILETLTTTTVHHHPCLKPSSSPPLAPSLCSFNSLRGSIVRQVIVENSWRRTYDVRSGNISTAFVRRWKFSMIF